MHWRTKATIQRVLSGTPGGERIYYGGQFAFGRLRNYSVAGKVRQARRLLDALARSGRDVAGTRTVEIGTGWAPAVPLVFWLAGGGECRSFDTSRLLSSSLVRASAAQLLARTDDEFGFAVHADRRESLERLVRSRASGEAILEGCAIDYRAPADAARTGLPDASVDVVFSNTVLEHVPPETATALFLEARRILAPGGVALHLIDTGDHFAHTDRSISTINFLRFSERDFARFNSRFLYQNRLRASAWRELIEACGFEVRVWEPNVNRRALDELPRIKLDDAFAGRDADDLCTSSVAVVAAARGGRRGV